jgi:hypothetical protein
MARRREPSRRRKVQLASFGTAVGIVTSFVTIALGAFDLRDKVDSVDASDSVPVSASYAQAIGDVCGERDEGQETRRRDAFELKRRMRAARRFPQQRLLILEFVNRELDRGDYVLSKFAGTVAPSEVSDDHRSVQRVWERIGDRLRDHRDRIEASVNRAGLVEALDRLNRSLAETQARNVDAGLRRLGGTGCHMGPPPALPVVNLPADRSARVASASATPGQDTVVPRTARDPETPSQGGEVVPDQSEPEANQEQGGLAAPQPDVEPPRYAIPPAQSTRPDVVPPTYRRPPSPHLGR